MRYHCTRLPDVDLCPEAFAEGRFPPACTAADFIRIDAADPKVPTLCFCTCTYLYKSTVLAHRPPFCKQRRNAALTRSPVSLEPSLRCLYMSHQGNRVPQSFYLAHCSLERIQALQPEYVAGMRGRCRRRAGAIRSSYCCWRVWSCTVTAGQTSRSMWAQRARCQKKGLSPCPCASVKLVAPLPASQQAISGDVPAGKSGCADGSVICSASGITALSVQVSQASPFTTMQLPGAVHVFCRDARMALHIAEFTNKPEGMRCSACESHACIWPCAQVQCITHFLQLPIEDEFLADLAPAAQPGRPIAEEGAGSRVGDDGAPGGAATELIPFADAGNPVMAQAPCVLATQNVMFVLPVKVCTCSVSSADARADVNPSVDAGYLILAQVHGACWLPCLYVCVSLQLLNRQGG